MHRFLVEYRRQMRGCCQWLLRCKDEDADAFIRSYRVRALRRIHQYDAAEVAIAPGGEAPSGKAMLPLK